MRKIFASLLLLFVASCAEVPDSSGNAPKANPTSTANVVATAKFNVPPALLKDHPPVDRVCKDPPYCELDIFVYIDADDQMCAVYVPYKSIYVANHSIKPRFSIWPYPTNGGPYQFAGKDAGVSVAPYNGKKRWMHDQTEPEKIRTFTLVLDSGAPPVSINDPSVPKFSVTVTLPNGVTKCKIADPVIGNG